MNYIANHLTTCITTVLVGGAIITCIFVALLFNAFIGDGALHDYVSQLFTAFAG